MSSSVKLHIVSALDQTTRLKEGLDWLLGRHHVQVTSTSGVVPSFSKSATSTTSTGLAGVGEVKKEPIEETSAANDGDLAAGHLTGYQCILNIMTTKQVKYTLLLMICYDHVFGPGRWVTKSHSVTYFLLLLSVL